MRKSIFIWLAWLILCSSCKQAAEQQALMTSLRNSLENASHTIGQTTQLTMAALEKKSTTPSMSAKAAIWLPKAEKADKYKNKFTGEIDRIANACDTNGENCSEKDMISLISSAKDYSDSTLSIDPLIKAEFIRHFTDSADNVQSISSILNQLKAPSSFSKEERIATFAQLKLSVIQNTNRVVVFCNEQVSDPAFYCTFYSAIIAQNSDALLPGEQLEITAGIGAFSLRVQPVALINGKSCKLRDDGTFKYNLRPKGKPGIYTVPVILDFLDEDGMPKQINKNITYRLLASPTGL